MIERKGKPDAPPGQNKPPKPTEPPITEPPTEPPVTATEIPFIPSYCIASMSNVFRFGK
jgi:hypothetical protein